MLIINKWKFYEFSDRTVVFQAAVEMVIIMKNLNGYMTSEMVMENTVTGGGFSS
jgi:hypothetical protein